MTGAALASEREPGGSHGRYINYACNTMGMHPGQGHTGSGYDAVTYNVGVFVQDKPGNWHESQAAANMEGLARRVMYQGPDVFDVSTGKPLPPLP